jgi:hypothetical protein
MAKKITVEISGTVTGYLRENEEPGHAQARIALEAEMRINAIGDLRGHIHLPDAQREQAEKSQSRI